MNRDEKKPGADRRQASQKVGVERRVAAGDRRQLPPEAREKAGKIKEVCSGVLDGIGRCGVRGI